MTSQASCDFYVLKNTKPSTRTHWWLRTQTPCNHTVHDLYEPAQQTLTNSKNVAQNHPKTNWPSVWVPVTRWVWVVGTQGCSHAVTEDQVVVGLWNARGKDVATTSQLGCPPTAVVPRVSGSGKPPHGCAEDSCAKPPAAAPPATHLSSLCRRMSDNETQLQEFTVWLSTITDAGEPGLTVVTQQLENNQDMI